MVVHLHGPNFDENSREMLPRIFRVDLDLDLDLVLVSARRLSLSGTRCTFSLTRPGAFSAWSALRGFCNLTGFFVVPMTLAGALGLVSLTRLTLAVSNDANDDGDDDGDRETGVAFDVLSEVGVGDGDDRRDEPEPKSEADAEAVTDPAAEDD